jgi:lipopolysaccharide exporter
MSTSDAATGEPAVPEESLGRKAIKGGVWVAGLRIVSELFVVGRLVILAHLLAPAAFGVMGIALLTMEILDTFSQTGFENALIQKKGGINDYLDSVWTITIARGVVLFGILYLVAPLAAQFFKEPAATPVIRVVGLSMVIQALTNIGIVYLDKELTFNRLFLYEFSTELASFVAAVTLAFLLRNVWALVFSLLIKRMMALIMSYIISAYRPRLDRDIGKAKELWAFGRWILGSRILLFLTTQGDDIVVGRLLGATTLGYYQMAFRISNVPATEIAHTISKVTFPVYARLQDNISRLRDAFLRTLTFTTFLSAPVAAMIIALAADFVQIFLGKKWIPIVVPMQVIALTGLARSIASTTNPVFQATNKPYIDTQWAFIRFVIMALLILPLTRQWGMVGASWAVFISMFVSTVAFCVKGIGITTCSGRDFNRAIILPLLGSVAIVGSVSLFRSSLHDVGLWQFLLLAAVGGGAYLAVTLIGDLILNTGLRPMLEEIVGYLRDHRQPGALGSE